MLPLTFHRTTIVIVLTTHVDHVVTGAVLCTTLSPGLLVLRVMDPPVRNVNAMGMLRLASMILWCMQLIYPWTRWVHTLEEVSVSTVR